MVSRTLKTDGQSGLYAMIWRWHLLAALLVIPFVLWQSTTGTLYLWAEEWLDHRYSQLRFVEPEAQAVPPSVQLRAAIAAIPNIARPRSDATDSHRHHEHEQASGAEPSGGPPVQEMILPGDSRRSTTVLFLDERGLPFPVFIDPHDARVLGVLTYSQWLPGISKALHGGWPLGKPGSWLLELADGWAIFMIASGFYLWWPRRRGLWRSLIPRFGNGARIMLRDLHATVAVLFSGVFLFFLISALPWTSFWGGEILSRIQKSLGQTSALGFSPGGAGSGTMAAAARSIDSLVAEARSRGLGPTITVRLAPWPGASLHVSSQGNAPADDRVLHGDPVTGAVRRDARSADDPAIPRIVVFGIHVHQGDFGRWNVWLNTFFAISLIWLSVTGVASWWLRRPARRLGIPPKVALRWPRSLIAAAVAMCVLMPIFGASVLLLSGFEKLMGLGRRAA